MNKKSVMSKQTNIKDFFNTNTIENSNEIKIYNISKKRLITDFFSDIDDNINDNIDDNINNVINDDINKKIINNDIDQNKRIEIYTDGSSYNNGKRNCRASWAYNIYEDDICVYRDAGKCNMTKQSNQVAELLGIFNCINKCYQVYKNIQKIYIYSDSLYSIKCINEWSNNWTSNDWNQKKNTEIIKKIKNIIAQCKFEIIFIHIFSHQNSSNNKHHIRNNIVDKEAKKINNNL
jgi:ribonuclease HI